MQQQNNPANSNVLRPDWALSKSPYIDYAAISYKGWHVLHIIADDINVERAAAIVEGLNGNWDKFDAFIKSLDWKIPKKKPNPTPEPRIVQCQRCGDHIKDEQEGDVIEIQPYHYCYRCADFVLKNGCSFTCYNCKKTKWGRPNPFLYDHYCGECFKRIQREDDLMDEDPNIKINALIEVVDELRERVKVLEGEFQKESEI